MAPMLPITVQASKDKDENKTPEKDQKPENDQIKSKKSVVNAIASYIAHLFPKTVSAGATSTVGDTSTMSRANKKLTQKLRQIVELKQREYESLRMSKKSKQKTPSVGNSMKKAEKSLRNAKKLLSEIKLYVEQVKKTIAQDASKATSTGFQAVLDEMLKVQQNLEKHTRSQEDRLRRFNEQIADVKGTAWKNLQDIKERQAKIDKYRTDAQKRFTDLSNKSVQESVTAANKTLVEVSKDQTQIQKKIQELKDEVNKRVNDPKIEEIFKSLEKKIFEQRRNAQRAQDRIALELKRKHSDKIRAKAKELKEQLNQLRELTKKNAQDNLGPAREETLRKLKKAAEVKRIEIKKLLEEVAKNTKGDKGGEKK